MKNKEYFPFSNLDDVIFEVRERPHVDLFQIDLAHQINNQRKFFLNSHLNNERSYNRNIYILKKNYKNEIKRILRNQDVNDQFLFEIYEQCVKHNLIRPLQEDERRKQISFIDLTLNRKELILFVFTLLIQKVPNIIDEINQKNHKYHSK